MEWKIEQDIIKGIVNFIHCDYYVYGSFVMLLDDRGYYEEDSLLTEVVHNFAFHPEEFRPPINFCCDMADLTQEYWSLFLNYIKGKGWKWQDVLSVLQEMYDYAGRVPWWKRWEYRNHHIKLSKVGEPQKWLVK